MAKSVIYQILLYSVLFVCIVGVFYFSWVPNPGLETETYLPLWIRQWSNYYYNLRTAVPFVGIGFLLTMLTHSNNPIKRIKTTGSLFILNMGITVTLVCIAEGGQFLIQTRNPDLMDVFFGILGSLVGGGVYFIIHKMNFKILRNAQ